MDNVVYIYYYFDVFICFPRLHGSIKYYYYYYSQHPMDVYLYLQCIWSYEMFKL